MARPCNAAPGRCCRLCCPRSIYDMLCSWGIINFKAAAGPGAAPQQQQQPGGLALGARGVSGAMPPGTACLFDFKVGLQEGGVLLAAGKVSLADNISYSSWCATAGCTACTACLSDFKVGLGGGGRKAEGKDAGRRCQVEQLTRP